MVITYQVGHTEGHSLKGSLCDFCCRMTPSIEAIHAFENYSRKGACFAAALDGDTVVGSSLNVPASQNAKLAEMPELITWLDGNGHSLSKIVYPAMIYVDPDYSGLGIGDKISVMKSQHSIEDGYTHTILFGYETQAIFDYSTRIGSLIDTGCDDWGGFRIYLRRLEDVVSALTKA